MTRKRDLARRARATTGEVVRSDLLCLACGHEAEAWYRRGPELFVCPNPDCGRRAAVRDDDQPYPPPADPLPM